MVASPSTTSPPVVATKPADRTTGCFAGMLDIFFGSKIEPKLIFIVEGNVAKEVGYGDVTTVALINKATYTCLVDQSIVLLTETGQIYQAKMGDGQLDFSVVEWAHTASIFVTANKLVVNGKDGIKVVTSTDGKFSEPEDVYLWEDTDDSTNYLDCEITGRVTDGHSLVLIVLDKADLKKKEKGRKLIVLEPSPTGYTEHVVGKDLNAGTCQRLVSFEGHCALFDAKNGNKMGLYGLKSGSPKYDFNKVNIKYLGAAGKCEPIKIGDWKAFDVEGDIAAFVVNKTDQQNVVKTHRLGIATISDENELSMHSVWSSVHHDGPFKNSLSKVDKAAVVLNGEGPRLAVFASRSSVFIGVPKRDPSDRGGFSKFREADFAASLEVESKSFAIEKVIGSSTGKAVVIASCVDGRVIKKMAGKSIQFEDVNAELADEA